MRTLLLCLISALVFSSSVLAAPQAPDSDRGLINIKSHHDVNATADRLVDVLEKKGMTIFGRINHSEGAQKVGLVLPPTELVLFGNPKVGTPLMQCGQSSAIDLPQKALIWEDDKKQVWFTYNDPAYIAKRHSIDGHSIDGCSEIINKITKALANFAQAATKP